MLAIDTFPTHSCTQKCLLIASNVAGTGCGTEDIKVTTGCGIEDIKQMKSLASMEFALWMQDRKRTDKHMIQSWVRITKKYKTK